MRNGFLFPVLLILLAGYVNADLPGQHGNTASAFGAWRTACLKTESRPGISNVLRTSSGNYRSPQ